MLNVLATIFGNVMPSRWSKCKVYDYCNKECQVKQVKSTHKRTYEHVGRLCNGNLTNLIARKEGTVCIESAPNTI